MPDPVPRTFTSAAPHAGPTHAQIRAHRRPAQCPGPGPSPLPHSTPGPSHAYAQIRARVGAHASARTGLRRRFPCAPGPRSAPMPKTEPRSRTKVRPRPHSRSKSRPDPGRRLSDSAFAPTPVPRPRPGTRLCARRNRARGRVMPPRRGHVNPQSAPRQARARPALVPGLRSRPRQTHARARPTLVPGLRSRPRQARAWGGGPSPCWCRRPRRCGVGPGGGASGRASAPRSYSPLRSRPEPSNCELATASAPALAPGPCSCRHPGQCGVGPGGGVSGGVPAPRSYLRSRSRPELSKSELAPSSAPGQCPRPWRHRPAGVASALGRAQLRVHAQVGTCPRPRFMPCLLRALAACSGLRTHPRPRLVRTRGFVHGRACPRSWATSSDSAFPAWVCHAPTSGVAPACTPERARGRVRLHVRTRPHTRPRSWAGARPRSGACRGELC
ncbi:hypothetical protein FHU30_001053 [Actinomadura rupiterrae]|nr:hypothetical protein [Actinomadura rupiterrae]